MIDTGSLAWNVVHTPGHTAGHVSLFAPAARLLVLGDLLHGDDVGWLPPPSRSPDALALAADSVARVAALRADAAVSGHGEPVADVAAACEAAAVRLRRWRDAPDKIAWHASKPHLLARADRPRRHDAGGDRRVDPACRMVRGLRGDPRPRPPSGSWRTSSPSACGPGPPLGEEAASSHSHRTARRRRAGVARRGCRPDGDDPCFSKNLQPSSALTRRHQPGSAAMSTILLVVLIVLLIGALPTWGYSGGWGYFPSGGLGLVLLIVIVLLVLGRI